MESEESGSGEGKFERKGGKRTDFMGTCRLVTSQFRNMPVAEPHPDSMVRRYLRIQENVTLVK